MVAPTLVVLAAGRGSRYGGLKQLDRIGPSGETIIDYSVFDALKAGFRKIVFVIDEQSSSGFDETFAALKQCCPVSYCFQQPGPAPRAKPYGTGHALLSVVDSVKEPFAVINADDYYGESAFAVAANFLSKQSVEAAVYGMLGYSLRDTLTPSGRVSRALCNMEEDGLLTSVTEHLQIALENGLPVSTHPDGRKTTLTGSEPTSMNFWLLTPAFFGFLETTFQEFARENKHDPDAEFQLPDIVGQLLKLKLASVRVLPHSGQWAGLTYAEDRDIVVNKIARLHATGRYPSPLWNGVPSH